MFVPPKLAMQEDAFTYITLLSMEFGKLDVIVPLNRLVT